MARTALTAPAHVVLQRSPGQFTGATQTVSPDAAISLSYAGAGILDHRMPYNKYNNVAPGTIAAGAALGWASDGLICTCDQVPTIITTGSIAAAANAASGVAQVLVTTSGAGSTVLSAALTSLPFLTSIPVNAVACETNMSYTFLGARDRTVLYDPTKALTRAVAVTGVASGTGGNFTVVGYDIYGQAMSEVIAAGAGVSTVAGKKAFKWIVSITPAFTDAHTYSWAWTDIFGFHIAVDRFAYMDTYFNDAIVASTGLIGADTTSPATTTTGDVRGTVGPTSLTSNTTKRLQLFVSPSSARITQSPLSVGLFGVVPV